MPLNPFKKEKSLDELQEEDDRLSQELSILKKQQEAAKIRQAMRQLDERGGKGFWRKFSDNGGKSGFSVGKALSWLRSH